MKKHWFFTVLIVLFSLVLVACDGILDFLDSDGQDSDDTTSVVQNEDTLAVYTNIADDGTVISRGLGNQVAMPEVHGVLLKYHNEGLYSYNNSFFKNEFNQSTGKFKHENAFYLEYLGNDEETWYGMTFNYVLYVPSIIQETYEEGGGINPKSGNPFWWYMSTYYGRDINNVRSNWADTVALLQKHKVNGVRKPHKEDVRGIWSISYNGNATNNQGIKFNRNIGFFYYDENEDQLIFAERILYYAEPVPTTEGGSALYQIFIPMEIDEAYSAGSGVHNSFDALMWYFEKYYNTSQEDVVTAYRNGTFGDLLESCYSQYGYIEPSAYDVDCLVQHQTVQNSYSGELKGLSHVYYYIPGTLKLEEGTIVEDCERVFIQINNDYVTIYVPESYVSQMKAECEQRGLPFRFNGNLVWYYFSWILNHSCENYPAMTEAEIRMLFQYRASEGMVPVV